MKTTRTFTMKAMNDMISRYTMLRRFLPTGRILPAAIACAVLLFSTSGCSDRTTAGDTEHVGEGHDHSDEGAEEIRFQPEQMKEVGITVEAVAVGALGGSVGAPGRVVPTQEGVAHVGTLVAGRVARIFVREGARVARGAPLAEIESFGIGELKAEYLRAMSEVERRGSEYRRQQRLIGEGVGAQRNLEESKASYEQSVASHRAAETKLTAAGISPGTILSDAPLDSRVTIRSPIAGIVSKRHVALGEYLEPDQDAFEVVDNRTIWIDAQVPPTEASLIAVGGTGIVQDAERHRHEGKVTFISPTVDPDSRMVNVRVELANPDAHLRPESYVSVEFRTESRASALTVPREALEKEGEEYYVYREQEPNTFVRVPVHIEIVQGDMAVVGAGVSAGDRIVTTGLFYLKSVRQREELQEHDH